MALTASNSLRIPEYVNLQRLTLIMNGGLFNMPAVAHLSKLSARAFNH